MPDQDISWIQRFNNFSKAMNQLRKFINKKHLNELEKQGLIQAFEYTYELAWNVIKDYFEAQGDTGILGSRDAFRRGLIQDGDVWMDMITSRSLTSHTYNEETAEKIVTSIRSSYYQQFDMLHIKMENLQRELD
ncbi:nucleotidyltransferase substrate binding protein [candidate division KSB1 bacterium]|nr:nucleotidyltransferase substrate binding protein [candidate division KSB1 bacterium]